MLHLGDFFRSYTDLLLIGTERLGENAPGWFNLGTSERTVIFLFV